MKKLIAYILQFGSLNSQQPAVVESSATEMLLQKKEYFSETGKIPG